MAKKIWKIEEVSTVHYVDDKEIPLTDDERNQMLIDWNEAEETKEEVIADEEKKKTDKASAKAKLQALGLTSDEITAITKT